MNHRQKEKKVGCGRSCLGVWEKGWDFRWFRSSRVARWSLNWQLDRHGRGMWTSEIWTSDGRHFQCEAAAPIGQRRRRGCGKSRKLASWLQKIQEAAIMARESHPPLTGPSCEGKCPPLAHHYTTLLSFTETSGSTNKPTQPQRPRHRLLCLECAGMLVPEHHSGRSLQKSSRTARNRSSSDNPPRRRGERSDCSHQATTLVAQQRLVY